MSNEITKIVLDQKGDRQRVKSGGEVQVESGGLVDVESGGTVDVNSGATLDLKGAMDVAVGGIISLGDAAGLSFAAAALLTVNAGTFTIPLLPSNAVSANLKKWIELSIGGDTYYFPAIKKT